MKTSVYCISCKQPDSRLVTWINEAAAKHGIQTHVLELQQIADWKPENGDSAALFLIDSAMDIRPNLADIRTLSLVSSPKYFLFITDVQQNGSLGLSVELSLAIGSNWRFVSAEHDE